MLKLVVIQSLVAFALGAAIPDGMVPQLDGRIVGGTTTTISNFPYQVSLHRNGGHSCAGSIYNDRVIVTAAHCLQKNSASDLKVRAGSTYWNSGGVYVSIASFTNHPDYDSRTMVNDIAVVRLSSPLSYSSNIGNINLASSYPAAGASLVVTGWGTLNSGGSMSTTLQRVNVTYITTSACASSTYNYGSSIKDGMICATARGKDSCKGDSGGPLAYNGALLGVVSWGYGCAYPRYPGVYASIPKYRSWIINTA